MTVETPKPDTYWATKDVDDLIPEIVKRRDAFQKMLVSSGLYARIERSYRYYHGLYHDDTETGGMAIQMGDEEGGTALANINHFRSNLEQQVTYVGAEKPSWVAKATNSGFLARRKTILVRELLDSYIEALKADKKLLQAIRHGFLLTMGFIYVYWDWSLGRYVREDMGPSSPAPEGAPEGPTSSPPVTAAPEESQASEDYDEEEEGAPPAPATPGESFYEGDLAMRRPSLFDTSWDFTIEQWDDNPWVNVKTPENRWELLHRFGGDEKMRQAIINAPRSGQVPPHGSIGQIGLSGELTDMVDVHHFWHVANCTMPNGRHVAYIGDQTALVDEDNDFRVIPLARLAFSDFVLTCMCYSNAFDMQVPQEWMGAAISTKLTVLNTLGEPKVAIHEDDEPTIDELEPGSGIATIRYRQAAPQVLDFYAKGTEGLAEDLSLAIQQQEYMAGTNPVSRGQPEGELKGASGSAFALLDSKSLQASSVAVKTYKDFLGEVGTIIVHILKARAKSKRVRAVVGEGNLSKLLEWSAEDLAEVETVAVEAGTPLQRSYFGRVQLAESLAEKDWITTPQEFLTVVETGQWKPLVDSVESQLNSIAEENQRLIEHAQVNDELLGMLELAQSEQDLEDVKNLLQQFGVVALRTDNHILHARRNLSILDSTEVRMNRGIAIPSLAHGWVHLEMMKDPEIQREQLLLGYLTAEQLQAFLASLQIPTAGAPAPGIPAGPGGPPGGPPGATGEAVGDAGFAGPQSTTPAPMNQTGQAPRPPKVPRRMVQQSIAQGMQS